MSNPRLLPPPATANEALMDRLIRHQVYLLRVSNRQAAQIRRLLDESRADALGLLTARLEGIAERGFDLGPATTARLEALFESLDALLTGSLLDAERRLGTDLDELAEAEAVYARGVLKQTLPVQWEVVAPAPEALRSIAAARPFQGRILRGWFEGLDAQQKTAARDAIRQGMTQGETVGQIAARLRRGVLDLRGYRAESIVRSAVIHVSNHAREATYAANGDLVKAVKLIETLDTRTCTQCMALDGTVYELGKGPRPPHHGGCRGSSVPVLRSWRELGIPAADLPASTRASLDGQVPADTTYPQWLRRQSAAVQDEALGPARGKLFRAGVPVTAFADRQGRRWTLDELRTREADAFQAAGLGRAA